MRRLAMITTILLGIILSCYCAVAESAVYTIPGSADMDQNSFLLQSGETIHIMQQEMEYVTNIPGKEEWEYEILFHAQCYEFHTEGNWTTCTRHCERFLEDRFAAEQIRAIITTEQHETFIMDDCYKLWKWTPDGEQTWSFIGALNTEGLMTSKSYDEDLNSFTRMVVHPDQVYVLFEYDNKPGCGIFGFDLATGKRSEICTFSRASQLIDAGGSMLLANGLQNGARLGKFYLIDCSNNSAAELPIQLPEYWSGICYGQGKWYLYGAKSLYEAQENGETMMLMAHPEISGWQLCTNPTGNTLYVLDTANRLNAFLLSKPEQNKSQPLIACGDATLYMLNSHTPNVSEYMGAHGISELRWADEPSGFNEIARSMILHDDYFDLMTMNVSTSHLEELFKKQYFFDLSGYEGIRRYMESVYPVYRNACMSDEQIAAIPVFAFCSGMLYNSDLWEEYALSDEGFQIPQTWDDLFDCILFLNDEGLLEEYRLFFNDGTAVDAYQQLLTALLLSYSADCCLQDGVLHYTDTELVRLLERLQMLKPILDDNEARALNTESFFCLEVSYSDLVSTAGTHVTGHSYSDAYQPMMLRLKNDSKPAIASRLLLIMVNPFSPNAEAAGRILEEMVLHPSPEWQTIFVQNVPVGIPAENSPEGWEVTPESAQIYYNALPYIWLETQEVHLLLGEYGLNPINRFITGESTADEFVAQLDQLMFTIQSEAW